MCGDRDGFLPPWRLPGLMRPLRRSQSCQWQPKPPPTMSLPFELSNGYVFLSTSFICHPRHSPYWGNKQPRKSRDVSVAVGVGRGRSLVDQGDQGRVAVFFFFVLRGATRRLHRRRAPDGRPTPRPRAGGGAKLPSGGQTPRG